MVSSHAEVALNRSLPVVLDVPWRLLNRLNGVALDGLEAGRSAQIWESWPPILLTGVAMGLVFWRARRSEDERPPLFCSVSPW